MATVSHKADEILDIAEQLVRSQGYNGFSFRDIATRAGIKSASVHYHFPAKADLGVAVARRYTDRFLAGLGDAEASGAHPEDLLARYVAAFRYALTRDGQMCLCGVLGAEITALPPEVAREAKRFSKLNLAWLERVLSRLDKQGTADPASLRRRALVILSALEGAMIVARSLGDPTAVERIAEGLSEAHLLSSRPIGRKRKST